MSDLPKGWESVKFGEVIELSYGKGLPKILRNSVGEYPVYGSNGTVGYHDAFLIKGPAVIIGRKGGAGIATYAKDNCWPIDTTYFVTARKTYDLKFVYYLISNLRLDRFDRSTAIPGLNRDDAYKLDISLPPLNEQKRIVAKIEELFSKLDSAIESLKTARAQLKLYRQAVLKHAFEGNHKEVKLSDLALKVGSGSTPKGGESSYQSEGIPLIRSMNIYSNGFSYDGLVYISEIQARKLDNVKLQKNDVLLNITGASIGRVCILPEELIGGRVNQHVSIIRLKQDILNPNFLWAYLASPRIQQQIYGENSGVTRQAITKQQILNFSVPIPLLEEQAQIVASIQRQFFIIDEMEQTIEEELQKSHSLRQSILKKAFSGQLVPQNPADEPASVLLERIRAEKIVTKSIPQKTKRRVA